ncbi:MAG: 50S ribosome-binding GTPase [Acidobacteriota bacterium]
MRAVKVVVLGPGEAGKSTLIARLCPDAINLHAGGRTVALDHGTLQAEGVRLHFFGVPGQERFAEVQETLLRGAHLGVVVVSTGQQVDPLTHRWSERLAAAGVPLLLVVNLIDGVRPAVSEAMLPPLAGQWAGNLAKEQDLESLVRALMALGKEKVGG